MSPARGAGGPRGSGGAAGRGRGRAGPQVRAAHGVRAARAARVLRATVARALGLGVTWWAVTEGDPTVRGYGVVVVLLVTASTFALVPASPRPARVLRRVRPALALAGWFLWRSVLGGADVAARAVHRTVRTDPVVLEHRLTLPAGAPRVLCANLSTLMPGALSADLRDDVLVLHVIDRDLPAREQLDALQRRIAAVLDA